jgi:hypothetical protein
MKFFIQFCPREEFFYSRALAQQKEHQQSNFIQKRQEKKPGDAQSKDRKELCETALKGDQKVSGNFIRVYKKIFF